MTKTRIQWILIGITLSCFSGLLVLDVPKNTAIMGAGLLWISWVLLSLKQTDTPPTQSIREPTDSPDNAIQKELEMAKRVQQGLLSVAPPEIKGLRIARKCIPADHIGGDFYTFIPKDLHTFIPQIKIPGITRYTNTKNSFLGVVIGDVAGHGVSSALVMALSAGVISQIGYNNTSPAKTFNISNNAIQRYLENSQVPYLTACYATINLANKTLTYANGGHPPILLVHKDNSIEELQTEGIFLGMYDNETYEEATHPLKKGDRIVMYTDGITETKNPENTLFEVDALKETLLAHQSESIDDTLEAVFNATNDFRNSKKAADDQTLLIVEIE